jgi:hypothetical protein
MEQLEQPKNFYINLKSDLLSGKLTFKDVRDKLFELDQQTESRDAAKENLNFLYDPEIVDLINSNPDYVDKYQSFLSLTEFHVAQELAIENKNNSLDHFKKALENSEKDSWSAYIEGTIFYMEGKIIPDEIITKAKVMSERNAKILLNFNLGLKKRGNILYEEDYFK